MFLLYQNGKFCLLLLLFSYKATAMLKTFLPRHVRKSSKIFRSSTRLSSFQDNNYPISNENAASKYFEFEKLEKEIYTWWEGSGYFKPSVNPKNKKHFVIPMPPPNVTGYLHMGHALFVAIEDIMTRFHRMRGKSCLWLPGTDHAGIATQLLVERSLAAQGISRQSLGRELFLEKVWAWKEEKGGYITQQMRRLGASADWSRERFTLEPDLNNAVIEAFVRLHEKGLVYRGDYLVNWSPNLQTAVSDLEVEYSEEQGSLYFFKYELDDGTCFIPVATTRPETLIGDTAICVNPADERYKKYIGKFVRVPMCNRTIPVIADEFVDIEFGTGAVKITPAHDPNDYEVGKRHNLPMISIMNKDASINHHGGPMYAGLDRFECRKKIWSDIESQGLAIKVVPHMQRVPRSQRGGEVIEPMVSGQWFIKMDEMAARAVTAVKQKDLQLIPERFDRVWFNWLENIKDWCVSRQLWWGHRIPAYYVDGSATEFIVARSKEEAQTKAIERYGHAVSLSQDEDVLDTWFSSGLWPFATVGWPHEKNANDDFQRFYPASVLETGYDILFFWVARMVMLGLEFTDKVPFHTIYLHGLVRDGEGRKMSKTTGNVIDPLDTIDKYGCDALRFSLVTGTTPGQDVPLSMEKIESNRNFVNKLWNVGKYIQNSLSTYSAAELKGFAVDKHLDGVELDNLPVPEKFIVTSCHQLAGAVTELLENYNFGEAGRLMYNFLWDDLADWYIEISKTRMNDATSRRIANRVLVYVWDSYLRLLHPYMPYVTEVLWQIIPHDGSSIMIAEWPLMEDCEELPSDALAADAFKSMQALVKSIRNLRAEYNTEPGKKIGAIINVNENKVGGSAIFNLLKTELPALSLLARLNAGNVEVVGSSVPLSCPSNCIHLIVEDGLEAYIPLSDIVDKEKEILRLSKQAEKILKDINALETRLTSKGFADKAPPHILLDVRSTLKEKRDQLESVEKSITEIKK